MLQIGEPLSTRYLSASPAARRHFSFNRNRNSVALCSRFADDEAVAAYRCRSPATVDDVSPIRQTGVRAKLQTKTNRARLLDWSRKKACGGANLAKPAGS
jgi:hypothetical protein